MIPEQMLNWILWKPISVLLGQRTRRTHPPTLLKLLSMLAWAVKSWSITFPRVALSTAFMTMYDEYKKAITAPRAETSAYLVAAEDDWWLDAIVNGVRLTVVTSRESRLDVGGQRDIASGPTGRNGDEASSGPPSPCDILLGNGAEVRQNPNYVESEGINPEPGDLRESVQIV